MSELIKDSAYRKFMETKPKTPKASRSPKSALTPPWVVYIQREVDGPWAKREFWKYSEAFHFWARWMKKGCHDSTINNKRIPTEPPMRLARIKGKYVTDSQGKRVQATKYVQWKLPTILLLDQPEHHWCLYCRRPTIFKFYTRHKRLGGVDPSVPRCCICGASSRIALAANDRMYRVN